MFLVFRGVTASKILRKVKLSSSVRWLTDFCTLTSLGRCRESGRASRDLLSRSDHSSVILFFVLVWSGRELGWAVYVCFSMLVFCVRPSMVLNQRQVSFVVSD